MNKKLLLFPKYLHQIEEMKKNKKQEADFSVKQAKNVCKSSKFMASS